MREIRGLVIKAFKSAGSRTSLYSRDSHTFRQPVRSLRDSLPVIPAHSAASSYTVSPARDPSELAGAPLTIRLKWHGRLCGPVRRSWIFWCRGDVAVARKNHKSPFLLDRFPSYQISLESLSRVIPVYQDRSLEVNEYMRVIIYDMYAHIQRAFRRNIFAESPHSFRARVSPTEF